MGSTLKKQIEETSITRLGKQIKSFNRKTVSSRQPEIEEKYQLDFANDGNQIALLGKQSSQRELLSYKIFPEPKDKSKFIFDEFGDQYLTSINKLIARVNGRDCPTDAEIKRYLKVSGTSDSYERSRRSRRDKSGALEKTVKDALCLEKAQSSCVYANPSHIGGYEFWEEYEYLGTEEAILDCWYWQLGNWIIEDIIETIADLNFGSNNVLMSPVKRLMWISLTSVRSGFSLRTEQKTSTNEKPSYILSAKDGLTISYTERFNNNDIDVMHFNFAIIINSKDVPLFMRQLCSTKEHKFKGFYGKSPEQTFQHNQITILESNIVSINREYPEHELYRYGDNAVVQLDLTCEYIFNKSGYNEIKPGSVKTNIVSSEDNKRR